MVEIPGRAEREAVTQVVNGVGQNRHAVRPESPRDFQDREAKVEEERQLQVAGGAVRMTHRERLKSSTILRVVRARRISDVDWTSWTPVDPATLIFVVHDEQILLIRKKRGLGAGKINGPGGRLESDEAPAAGAARELREELGVGVADSVKLGEHRFQFVDGYSIHVHVYRATGLRGTPVETDEAVPMWVDIRAIPYNEMWEDDRIWLPLLLEGKQFSGYWIFDGDRMLDYRLDVVE